MNKNKVLEYFDASTVSGPVHIIGCGAVGSHVAEALARIGCEDIHLWDFDVVSPHNITNQLFTEPQIGTAKVFAVLDMILDINSDAVVGIHEKGWDSSARPLKGYVFLCVDSIALRREIVECNRYNNLCKGILDFRMRLTDAQHYLGTTADNYTRLLSTMNFTSEDAKDATPKSACNTELSVITTVKIISSLGVNNFIKLVQDNKPNHTVLFDGVLMTLDSF